MEKVHKVNADGSEQVLLGSVIWKEKPVRKRASRTGWVHNLNIQRLREIEKVIKARHGAYVPETDDGDLYVKAAAFSLSGQDMQSWCARWAPWASPAVWRPIEAAAGKRRCMMSANGVAGLLAVTMEERTRLGLNTIGACDMSMQERKAFTKQRKRDRDRTHVAQKRQAAGKQSRASYLATNSLSREKPWEAAGVSRRTWYRRGTSSSRVDNITNGDTPVPIIPPVPILPEQSPSGKAGGRGSGDDPPAGYQGAAPHGTSDRIKGTAA